MKSPQLAATLESFRIDSGNPQLTFARRLANENRWPLTQAHRVVHEYLRFIYLAAVSDQPVTPSVDEDQAWHLHLCYTRSYWQDMCEQVLKRALHHGPTQGGEAEESKYRDAYVRTLKLYQSEFGHPPPEDIWPNAAHRFSAMNAPLSVTTNRFIVIEKRQAKTAAEIASVVVIAIVGVLALAATGNLKPITGIVVIIVAAILIQSLARKRKTQGKNKDASGNFCGGGCSTTGNSGCGGDSGCGGGGCGGD